MRLKHTQSDPLPWRRITGTDQARKDLHWSLLQASPEAFDDFKVDREDFDAWLERFPCYELGLPEQPVGLLLFVTSGGNAWLQGALYDWRYEGREPVFLSIGHDLFERGEAWRITSTINTDRPTARAVMQAMGWSYEGTWRKAGPRDNDIEVWALLSSEVLAWQQQQQ